MPAPISKAARWAFQEIPEVAEEGLIRGFLEPEQIARPFVRHENALMRYFGKVSDDTWERMVNKVIPHYRYNMSGVQVHVWGHDFLPENVPIAQGIFEGYARNAPGSLEGLRKARFMRAGKRADDPMRRYMGELTNKVMSGELDPLASEVQWANAGGVFYPVGMHAGTIQLFSPEMSASPMAAIIRERIEYERAMGQLENLLPYTVMHPEVNPQAVNLIHELGHSASLGSWHTPYAIQFQKKTGINPFLTEQGELGSLPMNISGIKEQYARFRGSFLKGSQGFEEALDVPPLSVGAGRRSSIEVGRTNADIAQAIDRPQEQIEKWVNRFSPSEYGKTNPRESVAESFVWEALYGKGIGPGAEHPLVRAAVIDRAHQSQWKQVQDITDASMGRMKARFEQPQFPMIAMNRRIQVDLSDTTRKQWGRNIAQIRAMVSRQEQLTPELTGTGMSAGQMTFDELMPQNLAKAQRTAQSLVSSRSSRPPQGRSTLRRMGLPVPGQ